MARQPRDPTGLDLGFVGRLEEVDIRNGRLRLQLSHIEVGSTEGDEAAFPIDASTRVSLNDLLDAHIADLRPGDAIVVRAMGGDVREIKAYGELQRSPPEEVGLEGIDATIEDVDDGRQEVLVRTADGKHEYIVPSHARIHRQATLADLRRGDHARLVLKDDEVEEIELDR